MNLIDETRPEGVSEHVLWHHFATESNQIEGIFSSSKHREMTDLLLDFADTYVTVDRCIQFAKACGGELRDKTGMDVRVGNHFPPKGGADMAKRLSDLLDLILGTDPYELHRSFEDLHPFTDGNGRTGRAIWLWQMIDQKGYDLGRGFLHQWYYQSLNSPR